MIRYRTGRHWGVTIVREDLDPAGENDQLVAVIVNGDHTLAERICQLLNDGKRTDAAPAPRCPCGRWNTYLGTYDQDGYTWRCRGCLRAITKCECR